MKNVELVPYTDKWQKLFATEAREIARALEEIVVAVNHIGSTSIPAIYAKPIIDILVEVEAIEAVDRRNANMAALGYEVMGEFGISGRRYFRKNDHAGHRTHHVHIFTAKSAEALRHLSFRDYLIAHPAEAQAYSELKKSLAEKYPQSMESYIQGKDDFIKEIDRKAALFYAVKKMA